MSVIDPFPSEWTLSWHREREREKEGQRAETGATQPHPNLSPSCVEMATIWPYAAIPLPFIVPIPNL